MIKSLERIVDKVDRAVRVHGMRHEFWYTSRLPFSGMTDYYKVLGAKSYDDLRAYYKSLHAELRKKFTPMMRDGEYVLAGQQEDFND